MLKCLLHRGELFYSDIANSRNDFQNHSYESRAEWVCLKRSSAVSAFVLWSWWGGLSTMKSSSVCLTSYSSLTQTSILLASWMSLFILPASLTVMLPPGQTTGLPCGWPCACHTCRAFDCCVSDCPPLHTCGTCSLRFFFMCTCSNCQWTDILWSVLVCFQQKNSKNARLCNFEITPYTLPG